MSVRPHTPEEWSQVLKVLADAFVEEPAVVDLVRDLAGDVGFVPELSLVAEDAEGVVGYVLLTRAEVARGSDGALEALVLAPLGVAPGRQRQGIGTRLVEEALIRARDRGESAVFVLGDPAFYARFGFEPASPRGLEPPHPVEYADAWMALELRPGALEGRHGVVAMARPLEDPKYW
jgi:putative acetyltransferase